MYYSVVPKFSYSQNQEDIFLALALQDISPGFYVDVGASDPEIDSVTKYFYDLGWHGINVEPIFKSFLRFQKSRPRDINLNFAVGEKNKRVKIYESAIPGRHSLSKLYAEHLGATGLEHAVEQKTLTQIFDQYLRPDQEIHFLKVDVEGFEKQALEGLDFSKYRPWLVMVEALDPVTLLDESSKWENQILSAGYTFGYFDGLNKYYLESKQSHRKISFRRVNTLLAGFTRYQIPEANQQILELGDQLHEANQQILELGDQLHEANQQILELGDQLHEAKLQSENFANQNATLREQFLQMGAVIARSQGIESNYHLVMNSKIFRYTRRLRAFYSLVLFYSSASNSYQLKLYRLSQQLKRYPSLRKHLITIHYSLKTKTRKDNRVVASKGNIKLSHSLITRANQESIEKTFS